MQAVRQTGTLHELQIRKALFAAGYRYRVNFQREGTRIDIAFIGPKVAVFCDGCFWHGCYEHGTRARHNAEYWNSKITENIRRDRRLRARLRRAGWRVVRIWEHESVIRATKRIADLLQA
jgi:DNA mismatch endonuclease, patch repair protein